MKHSNSTPDPDRNTAAEGDTLMALAEELIGEAQVPALGADGPQDLERLGENAFASGRLLAKIGEAQLRVSADGLQAVLRGPLPQEATFHEVQARISAAGIRFGLRPEGIHAALPKKQVRRSSWRNDRSRVSHESEEFVVAQGEAPVAPQAAHIEPQVPVAGEEQVQQLRAVLAGYDMAALRQWSFGLPLVRPGQELARIGAETGRPGRDVFGETLHPPLPEGVELRAGENVSMADGGSSCVADTLGYAGSIDQAFTVISPLWIARDLMRCYLFWLPDKDSVSTPEPEDLYELLALENVIHGVDREAIENFCRTVNNGDEVARLTLIATGTECEPGRGAAWQFPIAPEQSKYFREIRRILSRSPDLDYLLEYSEGLAGAAVSAGQAVAVQKPAVPGKPGRDVFGEDFLPEETAETQIDAGDWVKLTDDGSTYAAEIFGYLGVSRHLVQVVPPVWVAPDRMTVHFINLPQLGQRRLPSEEEIAEALKRMSVSFGIDYQGIAVLCERLRQGQPADTAVVVARGKPPVAGRDGHIDFDIDTERRPGALREDGSIDFKRVNLAPMVERDQRIGVLVPARRGTPGTDVLGEPVSPGRGDEIDVELGENVRAEPAGDDGQCYFAEMTGELVLTERRGHGKKKVRLSVQDTLTIGGDVDYHTGNIAFDGNVKIGGAVRSGFSVKATGNVLIEDCVEDRSYVEAGGNVGVVNGIAGAETRLTAGGAVFAKYINLATVRSGAEITAGEYIFNGSVQAENGVTVVGKSSRKRSGSIIGGRVTAGAFVRAHDIGTEAGSKTRIVAGVNPGLIRQLARTDDLACKQEDLIRRILAALRIDRPDPDLLREAVLGARGTQRIRVAELVKKIAELQSALLKTATRKKQLEKEMSEYALQAHIETSGRIAAGTLVRIGGQTKRVEAKEAGVTHARIGLAREEGDLRLRLIAL